MNMKRKIRKAFKNATPYVLDRIAPPTKQVISAEAYTPAEESAPPKWNWREWAAMAAVLVLIVGSLVSGIQFVQNGGINPTAPAAPLLQPSDFVDGYLTEEAASRIAFSQLDDPTYLIGTNFGWGLEGTLLSHYNGTIPCYWVTYVRHPEGDFANYEYQTAYIDATNGQVLDVQKYNTIDQGKVSYGDRSFHGIWNLILEDDNALTFAEKLDLSHSFHVVRSGELLNVEKVSYEGYDYTFIAAPGGKLESIDIAIRDDRQDDQYIAKDVVREIVCLRYNLDLADGTSAYVTLEGTQYQVKINSEIDIVCQIDAITGEIVYRPISDENTLVQIRDIALAFHSITPEQCISIVNTSVWDNKVNFSFLTDTDRYDVTVDCASGQVVDNKTYHYDKRTLEIWGWDYETYIPYADALKRAVEFLGGTLEDLTELRFNIDSHLHTVSFTLAFKGSTRYCKVDLLTGQVSHNASVHMDTIAQLRDAALSHFGISLDDCWRENMNIDKDAGCINFAFFCGTNFYQVIIRKSDASIVHSSIISGYLTEFIEYPPAVGWQDARDIALNHLDLELEDLSRLFIDYDSENLVYKFTLESYPQPYTCQVSAIDGSVIHEIELEN